jgi:HAD superfamily hydrolase (TIGR01662 family)
MRLINCVLFDLGNTLIHEVVDDLHTLDYTELHAMPRAKAVLEHLHKEYSLAVITNTESSSESSVRAALKRLGLESYLSAVVTSFDVGARKPDERIFREALRRVDANPEEVAMVGNDLVCDMNGAKHLGMFTILFCSTCPPTPGNSVDRCIERFDQLPATLASLQRRSLNGPREALRGKEGDDL